MTVAIRSNEQRRWMRFVISDGDKFWTGTEWSKNSRDALLYHNASEARAESQKAEAMSRGLSNEEESWE